MADVFVSYSRKDTGFVRALHDFLTESGKDVWVDWDDIPPGSRWEQDIDDSIDGADSFVFVVSEHSLASEYCTGEFRHAGERGKRIVPIAPADVDPGLAPEALRQLNWIWCRETDDREEAFGKLLPALDTDLDWARVHTRLVVRAVEWDKRRDGSLLLRGRDLEDAVQQLAGAGGKEPTPTELQKEYVLASRRAGRKRQRIMLGSVSFALVVSIALGIVALLQRNTANERARQARSQALAAVAVERLGRDPPAALARAIAAFETKRTPEAETALRRAILANPIAYVIPTRAKPRSDVGRDDLAFGEDGKVLVGLTPNRRLHTWRTETGRPQAGAVNGVEAFATRGPSLVVAGNGALRVFDRRAPDRAPLRRQLPVGARVAGVAVTDRGARALVTRRGRAWMARPGGGRDIPLRVRRLPLTRAVFSDDGSRVLTLAGEGRARLWNALDGRPVTTLSKADTAAISRDGRYVATIYGSAVLWTVAKRVKRFDLGPAAGVRFSPDGSQVLTVGENGEARLWSSRDGRQLAAFPGFGTLAGARGNFSSSFSPGAAFSQDGQMIAIAAADRIVRVWEVATRKQVATVYAGWANALAFAPRGERLAAMTWDGDVVVAQAPASLALRTRFDPQAACSAEFTPVVSRDGRRVMARSGAGASIWTIDGRFEGSVRPPGQPASERSMVWAAAFSGDGTTVAAAALGNGCYGVAGATYRAAVWRLGNTRPIQVLESNARVLLDEDGGLVAVGPRVWRTTTGEPVDALDGLLDLSGDGRLALVARTSRGLEIVDVESRAVTARLRDTTKLARYALEQLEQGDVQAVLSADGRRVLTAAQAVRLWDAQTGEQLALLSREYRFGKTFGFGDGGSLALVASGNRTAVFRAADGKLVASAGSAADAISPDGALAANTANEGGVAILDLRTGTRATLQTATALPLDFVSFGPTADILIAEDREGDVHVVRCEICAAEDVLLQRARTTLARVSRFKPTHPPVTGVF